MIFTPRTQKMSTLTKSNPIIPPNTEFEAPHQRRAAVFVNDKWIIGAMGTALFVAVLFLAPVWKKNHYTAVMKEHRELDSQLKVLKTHNLLLQKQIVLQNSSQIIDSLAQANLGMIPANSPLVIEEKP